MFQLLLDVLITNLFNIYWEWRLKYWILIEQGKHLSEFSRINFRVKKKCIWTFQVWWLGEREPCHRNAVVAFSVGNCDWILLFLLWSRASESDRRSSAAAGHCAGWHRTFPAGWIQHPVLLLNADVFPFVVMAPCVYVCFRCLATAKLMESQPGLCCWLLGSVRSESSLLLWTPWRLFSPCQCFHRIKHDSRAELRSWNLRLCFAGFFSCVTCLLIWPVLFKRCCGRPTGGLASNTITGDSFIVIVWTVLIMPLIMLILGN